MLPVILKNAQKRSNQLNLQLILTYLVKIKILFYIKDLERLVT